MTWKNYWRCYRDCSDWLARWFLPWRWVVDFHLACSELRTSQGPDR